VKKFFKTEEVIRAESYLTSEEVRQIFGMAKILPADRCTHDVQSLSIEEVKVVGLSLSFLPVSFFLA
jgi:hypothetical protein